MNRKWLTYALGIVAITAFLISLPFVLRSPYWVSILIILGIYTLLVASLRTITLIGVFSLGHVGFMLIGAYSSALLVMRTGLSFWAAFIIAGLVSAAVALLLSYPFLRVKGIYFAILTLLTAETFRLVAWNWKSLTGGNYGLINIPAPNPLTIPGLGIMQFESFNSYYYLTLTVVVLSLFLLYRLEHSKAGFIWRAIREADILTRCVGINIMKFKIINFVVACFFAGVAGALFAHFQRSLSVDYSSTFGTMMSIYLIVYLVVGGPERFAGPILGATVLIIASEFARPLQENQPILLGVITILIVLYMAQGIVGLPNRFQLWYERALKRINRNTTSKTSLGG